MKVLWNSDLYTNTIHVNDLCRAICLVAQNDQAIGQVYNVVDEGCTTQGIINDIISKIFNIKISYIDNIITSMSMFKDRVRINIQNVSVYVSGADVINDQRIRLFFG